MARVLFGTTAGFGHFLPAVPLARAFVEAGHDVSFASVAEYRGRVEALGAELFPVGLDLAEVERAYAPHREWLMRDVPVHDRRPAAFRTRFGRVEAPGRIDGLHEVAARWSPDLVVYESADLAAPIVAAVLGIPGAQLSFGRLVPRAAWEAAAEDTIGLWERFGLEPKPLCGAFDGTYLDIVPPSFQTESIPGGARQQLLRPMFPAAPGEEPPGWLEQLSGRPLVYVTLGTAFNDLTRFRLLLDALADVDCDVVATIGRDNDPAELEPIPANARVEQYVSQSLLLPMASAAVVHGGSGSTLASLSAGLPLLVLPGGADQFENGGQASSLGAARMLMPDELTAAAVREAVVALLEEPSYRSAAQSLAAEIAAMPSPDEVAATLLPAG